MPPHPQKFDAIIFDIDNVLIDTRKSYLDAIRWTIELYLTCGKIPFFSTKKKSPSSLLLSAEDVEHFKMLGGFNDDWDCCYGLLTYLLRLPVKGRCIDDLKKAKNIKTFVAGAKERPLGVNGIVKLFDRNPNVLIERIGRIFQEVYLGKDLFETVESRRRIFWKKRGLIHREKLIFRKKWLERLRASGVRLGIATGRPRFEAVYILKHFGILELFEAVTTLDEVRLAEEAQKQSLRKPHPFSLLETAKKMTKSKRFLYVGDLPDDIMAAKAAGERLDMKSAAFPLLAADLKRALKEFEKVGPDFMLERPARLLKLVA